MWYCDAAAGVDVLTRTTCLITTVLYINTVPNSVAHCHHLLAAELSPTHFY